jgi:hypothetical protein
MGCPHIGVELKWRRLRHLVHRNGLWVQVVSVVAGVATCDKSLGTLSSTGGTGNLGGSMATMGAAAVAIVSGNTVWEQRWQPPGAFQGY